MKLDRLRFKNIRLLEKVLGVFFNFLSLIDKHFAGLFLGFIAGIVFTIVANGCSVLNSGKPSLYMDFSKQSQKAAP